MLSETGIPIPEANHESFDRQKLEEIYFSLQKIKRDLYPLFCKLSENPESIDFDSEALLEEFAHEPAFDKENYAYLRDKSSVSNFFIHDVAAFGVSLAMAVSLIENGIKDDVVVKTVVSRFPAYVSVLEDVLTRALEKDPSFVVEKKPLDIDFFDKSLVGLIADGESCSGRVRYLITKQFFGVDNADSFSSDKLKELLTLELNFEKFLQPDEEIITNQGNLTNSIFNIIRNACKKDFQANNVNFVVSRDGNEMVIQVCDDGVGMQAKQLNETSENFIFLHGAKSSTEAHTVDRTFDGRVVDIHGLGVSALPQRLKKNANGEVYVWSRKKDEVDKPYSVYPNDCQREVPIKSIPITADQEQQMPVSTVFEIRLPITKKAA
jgi:hypothetical protein